MSHGLDDDSLLTNLRTDALAREDRSFLNSRSVLHANSVIFNPSIQDQKSTIISTSKIGHNSVTTAPIKSNTGINVIGHSNNTSSQSKQPTSDMEDCLWANRTILPKPHYFLSAVVLLRIYKEDKAKLTTRELKQWLEYMRYSGVEHVYLYDAFVNEDEAQMSEIKLFLRDNYITYIDWHVHNPYTISGTQVSAYQHCIDHFG